jgi:hypothetical protein
MIISRTKYVIITKNRPTEFLMGSGELTEDFDQAMMLDDQSELENELSTLNEPEKFEAVEVVISVEV